MGVDVFVEDVFGLSCEISEGPVSGEGEEEFFFVNHVFGEREEGVGGVLADVDDVGFVAFAKT